MFKYIIHFLGLELPKDVVPLIEYGFNVAIICLVIFLCFINVFGYLITLYFVQNQDLENKYPKFKGIIYYFKKSSWVWITIEGLIGFSGFIILIYLGFSPLFKA